MPKVVIVVEASGQGIAASSTTVRMVSALKQAMPAAMPVEVIASNKLQQPDSFDLGSAPMWARPPGGSSESTLPQAQDVVIEEVLLCPLTLNLPDTLPFPAQMVYQACRDVLGLRQRLVQQLNIATADGCFWLPVVLTPKGPLYSEVIALSGEKMSEDLSLCSLGYYQPCHFSDASKQQLYQLGHCLLQLLSAPPATYLVQFGMQDSDLCFDRLWPFPAAPAIASLGVQEPDLFTCHWYCITGRSVLDLTIVPPSAGHCALGRRRG